MTSDERSAHLSKLADAAKTSTIAASQISTTHTADATEMSMKEGLGAEGLIAARTVDFTKEEEEVIQPKKKIPVLLIDEAHKLPSLIQSPSSMKTLLDSMLVLTKQDRLIHVVHATSDPFYMFVLSLSARYFADGEIRIGIG